MECLPVGDHLMLEEHVIQKQWFTGVPEGSLALSFYPEPSFLFVPTTDQGCGIWGSWNGLLLPSSNPFSRIAKSSLSRATLLPKTLCGLAICLKIF